MTAEEFENLLFQTKAELTDTFMKTETVKDMDVYVKTILDYNEIVAKTIFREIDNVKRDINFMKGDIIKDNSERFQEIMKNISELKSDKQK